VLFDDRDDLGFGEAGFPHDVVSFGVKRLDSTFIPGSNYRGSIKRTYE
jgi:hypothetical protein